MASARRSTGTDVLSGCGVRALDGDSLRRCVAGLPMEKVGTWPVGAGRCWIVSKGTARKVSLRVRDSGADSLTILRIQNPRRDAQDAAELLCRAHKLRALARGEDIARRGRGREHDFRRSDRLDRSRHGEGKRQARRSVSVSRQTRGRRLEGSRLLRGARARFTPTCAVSSGNHPSLQISA